jgi:hypothetical protein
MPCACKENWSVLFETWSWLSGSKILNFAHALRATNNEAVATLRARILIVSIGRFFLL